MKRLARFIHKLLWWLLYVTPVILSAYYFGGKLLRQYVIDELNEQLNVKVEVYRIRHSGLSTFPRIGLELTNVRIHESMPHYNDYMLQAKRVTVVFNPLKFISGENEIERIELHGGAVRMFTGQNGETNFEIFKPQDNPEDAPLNIDLKKVILSKFQCIYLDLAQDQSLNFKSDKLTFSGKFKDEKYALKSQGDALFDHLSIGGTDYIKGKYCDMDLVLDVNNAVESYHIEKGLISLDNLQLDVLGDVLMIGGHPDLDLQLTGNNIDVQSILSILPNNISYGMRELESSGEIGLNGHIKGSFDESSWPEIDVGFSFENASVQWKKRNLDCRSINLKGSLSNLKSKDSRNLRLSVDVEDVEMEKSYVKRGFILIENLNKPAVTFELQGLLDFTDVSGVLAGSGNDVWHGRTLFNLSGGIPFNEKRQEMDFTQSTVNGDIESRNLNYASGENKLIEGGYIKARVKGNDLNNVEVQGQYWKNDVNFKGDLSRWQGFLFGDQRLLIEGTLVSQFVNLNFGSNSSEEPAETTSNPEPVSLDFGFDANVSLTVDTFDWQYIHAGNLTGKLVWEQDRVAGKNLEFNAWEGKTQLEGEMIQTQDRFILNSSSIAENVKLEHLLRDFDNFGQSEFTPEILQGTLTSISNVSVQFDRYFEVIEDSVKGLADIDIKDGRLKDYEPMEELSGFVELDDLKDIRFAQLHNTIEIGERTIHIPSMEIKSNAMNLQIQGTHNFDNFMRYHMKIRVTELLASKSGWVKRKKERQLEEDRSGGLSAFILMEGTPDDLKIKYDRKAVVAQIKTEAKEETKNFLKELKREIKREKTATEDRKQVQWDE